MKRLLVVGFLLMMVLPAVCSAEIYGFVANRTNVDVGNLYDPQAVLWYQQDFHSNSKFSFFNWSQAGQYYKLTEFGLTYRLTPELQIGGGAGVENLGTKERYIAFASYINGKNFVLAMIENGGSGRWHQAYYSRSIGKFEVGAFSQEYLGVGPRFAYNFSRFTVWTTPLFERQDGKLNNNWIFALRFSFFRE